jgi:hypothetical protein
VAARLAIFVRLFLKHGAFHSMSIPFLASSLTTLLDGSTVFNMILAVFKEEVCAGLMQFYDPYDPEASNPRSLRVQVPPVASIALLQSHCQVRVPTQVSIGICNQASLRLK